MPTIFRSNLLDQPHLGQRAFRRSPAKARILIGGSRPGKPEVGIGEEVEEVLRREGASGVWGEMRWASFGRRDQGS